MHRIHRVLRGSATGRAGMTLTEVLLGLAVFLTGSVSIVGLFVTASVLHAEAANRRTASFIAEELLSEAVSMRFSEVFAKTYVVSDGGGTIDARAVSATNEYPAASFNVYPVKETFFPLQPGQNAARDEGPLLIGSEGIWYTGRIGSSFTGCSTRPDWGIGDTHDPDDRILQPRTWFYVLDDPGLAVGALIASVYGTPNAEPQGTNPGAPPSGYIVIDEEWIAYGNCDGGSFLNLTRGAGGTAEVDHAAGTPVTVAREHPHYPGFYYAVQFYPVNSTGSEARLLVSVGYRTGRMFRVWFFRSTYAPQNY